jgi:photosystem II stability/assembly factor-like uncharacterized protein
MKISHTLSAIFAVVLFAVNANAQWVQVTGMRDTLINETYLDIFFLKSDPQYGWACGFNGNTLRTTDGGETWDDTIIPIFRRSIIDGAYLPMQLEHIQFVNRDVGYVSGNGLVYRSDDGGETWTNVFPSNFPLGMDTRYYYSVWGVYPVDANTIIAFGGIGSNQLFFYSENGGQSWSMTDYEIGLGCSKLSDGIIFKKDSLGYATSSSALWRTEDGGRTWNYLPDISPPSARNDDTDWQEDLAISGNSILVPFSYGCTGDTLRDFGGVKMTVDSGRTWLIYETGQPMFGSFLRDGATGWGVGFNETVIKTTDGGQTWINYDCGLSNTDLDDIYMFHDTAGFIVGDGIWTYYTTDFYIEKSDYGTHCEGDTVEITLTEEFTSYLWNTGERTKSIKVTETGLYKMTTTDTIGCHDFREIYVEFKPNPEPDIQALDDLVFCVGDSVVLEGPPGYAVYEWIRLDNEVVGNEKNYVARESGTYQLRTMTEFGCENFSKEVDITVLPLSNQFQITGSTGLYSMGESELGYLSCRDITVTNIDDEMAILDTAFFIENFEFSIPPAQLPRQIAPGDTVELRICFIAATAEIYRDTLILNDQCDPHILPVEGLGVATPQTANTKCDVTVVLNPAETGFSFSTGVPYPNPTESGISIPYESYIASGSEPEFRASLYTTRGDYIAEAMDIPTGSRLLDTGKFIEGNLEFSLEALSSGLYIVIIEAGGRRKAFPVNVSK